MSLQRARYIHVQTKGGFRNGFSAQISPIPSEYPAFVERAFAPLTDKCLFRITYCNSTDAFCRREARAVLELKEWQEVRIVDVPRLLAEAEWDCRSKADKPHGYRAQWYSNQYAWVWKYFL